MLEKIPTPYSPAAADAADRLRLFACDLRLADAAVQSVVGDNDDREAIQMHLRRLISDAESLKDDILTADRKEREQLDRN